jgi:hypothetical protein
VDPKFPYIYNLADHFEDTDFPAEQISGKFTFADLNDDGYPDMLIWRYKGISPLKKESTFEDFVFKEETWHVRYFDTGQNCFAPSKVIKKYPIGQFANYYATVFIHNRIEF